MMMQGNVFWALLLPDSSQPFAPAIRCRVAGQPLLQCSSSFWCLIDPCALPDWGAVMGVSAACTSGTSNLSLFPLSPVPSCPASHLPALCLLQRRQEEAEAQRQRVSLMRQGLAAAAGGSSAAAAATLREGDRCVLHRLPLSPMHAYRPWASAPFRCHPVPLVILLPALRLLLCLYATPYCSTATPDSQSRAGHQPC